MTKPKPPTLGDVDYCTKTVERLLDKIEASGVDPRWAAIARTDFQRAFMSLRAAVFIKGKKL